MYFDENNNYFDIVENEDNLNIDIDKYIKKGPYNTNIDYDKGPYNTNVNIDNIIFNRHNDSIINLVEGFSRGSIFENTYSIYKNHKYMLKVDNERDKLLYKIQIYCFAIKDLNLYLDLHPNETDKLILFKKYNDELKKLKEEYNSKYSPLCLNDVNNTSKWTWINNPWPWDKGGNI